jgi:hypothetical protein
VSVRVTRGNEILRLILGSKTVDALFVCVIGSRGWCRYSLVGYAVLIDPCGC